MHRLTNATIQFHPKHIRLHGAKEQRGVEDTETTARSQSYYNKSCAACSVKYTPFPATMN